MLNDLSDVNDMKRKIRALYDRANNQISCFYDCSVNLKCLLWKTFANCLYGVGLRELGDV